MTSFIAIVPARLASTRLPNKPLADIAGLPMVVHVARRALQSGASRVVVAVDDELIRLACEAHGIEVLMTNPLHPTGTDRLSEVVQLLQLSDDEIVVNVQGDEPLIPPELINEVAHTLSIHSQAAIATAALAIVDSEEFNNPNVVKVVCNQAQEALYFSRAPIPFARNPKEFIAPYYRHIGMYAYRAGFLKAFAQLKPAPIEQAESLEQLRALYNGYKIAVMITPTAPPPGVDTAEDLERVRKLLGH
jgi:3-deoxy-manno-octulosonate cytidylyltransferase (CMP-KDO synthetase)